jgi:hypothetical protein
MGGFMEYNGNEPVQTLLPRQLNGYSLTGKGDFPRIAIEEIQDKSKGDFISKGLVVLQTGWFITQCIARGARGLPITELELVTVAFAGLNFVMYWVWWDKPLNVRRAVRVYKKPDSNDPSTDGLIVIKEGGFWPPLRRSLSALQSAIAGAWGESKWGLVLLVLFIAMVAGVWVILWVVAGLFRVAVDNEDDIIVDEKRIDTFYPPASTEWKSAKTDYFIYISLVSIAAVFGAIHCIAWPFPFPSDEERILWRVCSVVITGAPIAVVPLVLIVLKLDSDSWVGDVTGVLLWVLFFAYTTSRASLLVLAFLSLRALPPDAYRSVQWTSFIPHF